MSDTISDNQLGEQPSPYLFITELKLNARASKVLLGAGLTTVEDVLSALGKGDKELTKLKGFGPKSLIALKTELQEHGFTLPDQTVTPLRALEDSLEKELQELDAMETTGAATVEFTPQEPMPEPEPEPEPEPTFAPAPVAAPAPAIAAAPQAEMPSEKPTILERIRATLAQPREQFRFGTWIYAVAAVVIIIILLLPPVSLLERLGITGYTTFDADETSIAHEDGVTLSIDPETYDDRLSVRLETVPRTDLLDGSAGRALRKAVEVLPSNLIVKSPLYEIKTRGDSSQAVMIDVTVPNDAEPWETLDLYTWTGEEWKWVGSELHAEVAEHEFIRADVTGLPENLVVVQAEPVAPIISTPMEPGGDPMAGGGVVGEINPTGLFLGLDGGFVGDPNTLPQPVEGDPYTVLPAVRNWAPGATVNRGLLIDMLMTPEIQQAHVANIVQLCTERGFAGIEIDYQGVGPDERDAYSDFITALGDGLHAEGLRLTVAVEPPTPSNGGWDTGGYDWSKIGAAADAVKVPFPADPAAYATGGQAQRLLDWATARISRYKLHMLVSSLSAEQNGESINYISLEQALAPFGEVVTVNDVTQIESGNQVQFGLSGRLLSITSQDTAGTYRLEYQSEDGSTRTVWLGTASNLAAKLQWARQYNLGGIVVADILDPGNADGIAEAVRASADVPAGQEMQIVWTVTSETALIDHQASPLTQPDYTWTVLAANGDYTVQAAIADYDHGSVPISVGTPAPEATDIVIPTEEITTTEHIAVVVEPDAEGDAPPNEADTEPEEQVTADCLDAAYAADVSIPDNTQMDNDQEFVKTWRVSNTGTCAWPENTVIAFADNAQMGAPESVEVGAVEPGAQVEISVDMKAPAEAGQYTGVWQMKADEFFGGQLTVVILAGEVEAPVVVNVAPVSGGSFELGGHVRDTGHPYADKMHYAGMTWTKVQVRYDPGNNASDIIATAHARGFKIQLSALGSPGMVTEGGFEQNYANWVAQLASAGADAIEVWNEPNIDREWQIGHISPQAYTNLLCASYNAIKAANAGTAVISAAPAPTGFFGGCNENGCDDAYWMAGLRDAGAANCMDYIGAHHNSGATSPGARSGHPAGTHHSWYFLPQTEMYYNTFGGARKLFYTEMGYASQEGVSPFHSSFGWAQGTDNSEQAAWLAEAVSLSVNTGMVRCIIVWNVDYSLRYGYDPQEGFAILRPDGSCPACETLHSVLGTR